MSFVMLKLLGGADSLNLSSLITCTCNYLVLTTDILKCKFQVTLISIIAVEPTTLLSLIHEEVTAIK